MHVVLVSPRTPDTFWSFSHILPLIRKKAAFPPLGLLTVAAMLPDSWSIEVVDLNVGALTDEHLGRADAVLLSAMIVQEPSARSVIARCNARGVPVVGGGPLFTTGAERFPEADSCVIGEAEELMSQLADDLESGRLRSRYQAERRPDLGLTPLPRWDLINPADYATMTLQVSRGCPFDCEFCDITAVFGRKPRVKSPGQVLAELDALRAIGWNQHVFIVDDNFIGNRARIKAILRAIIEWRKRTRSAFTFTTEASVNLADDPELIALMTGAGFKNVFVGIESPQEASLRECSKVQNTRRDLVQTVRQLHRAGLTVMGGFIVGFDQDRHDIFERQRRFIQQSGVVSAMVGLLTALPGTRLHTRLTHEGRLLGPSSGNNLQATLNFVPKLNREVLLTGYRRLLRQLYAPRAYYARVLRLLRDYRPAGPPSRFGRDDFRAFVRSLWILGVRERGRVAFWIFMLRATLRRPRCLGLAAQWSIMGLHYRKIAMSS